MGRKVGSAVQPCVAKTCTLTVTVTRSDGQPLSTPVTVTVQGPQRKTAPTAGPGGVARFELGSFGTYRVSIAPAGDETTAKIAAPHPAEVKLTRGEAKSVAFSLEPPATAKIKVSRKDTSAAVPGATVVIEPTDGGTARQEATTGADGMASFAPFVAGKYRLTVGAKEIDGRSFVPPKSEYRLTLLAGAQKAGHIQLAPPMITVINLMDHGSTGTGHQASMVALLDSLVAYKFDGEVHLTYFRWKTKFWCGKLGVALRDGATAFAKHNALWAADYNGLAITCHPIGAGPDKYDEILNSYLAAVHAPAKDERTFWSNVFWETAGGSPKADMLNPNIFRVKKYWVPEEFRNLRTQIDTWITDWGVGEYSSAVGEALGAPPVIHAPRMAADNETLTMFAAFDSKDFGLLAPVKTMTGEDRPWTVILQPFLWANAQHAGAQVLHGDAVSKDIETDLAGQQLVPVFPKQIPDPPDPAAYVEAKDPAAANKETVKRLLTLARAKSVHLIAAYYTQASAVDVPYAQLLVVLVAALQHADLVGDDTPIVLALLGSEGPTAHSDAFAAAQANPDSLLLGAPGLLADLAPLKGKIVLEHIGRSAAMALFERQSLFFVSEGANTWQETLSAGMPTLSVRPTGETKPWIHALGVPAGAATVREASEAIVALATCDKAGAALRAEPAMAALVKFIKSARDEPDGDVKRYFAAWSEALKDPHGDQFLAAVEHLKEKQIFLRTK